MNIERGHVINASPQATKEPARIEPRRLLRRLRAYKDDPACFLIEAETPGGQAAGIIQDGLFSGYLLSLMSEDRLQDVIGKLSDEAIRKADECLKAALGIG